LGFNHMRNRYPFGAGSSISDQGEARPARATTGRRRKPIHAEDNREDDGDAGQGWVAGALLGSRRRTSEAPNRTTCGSISLNPQRNDSQLASRAPGFAPAPGDGADTARSRRARHRRVGAGMSSMKQKNARSGNGSRCGSCGRDKGPTQFCRTRAANVNTRRPRTIRHGRRNDLAGPKKRSEPTTTSRPKTHSQCPPMDAPTWIR